MVVILRISFKWPTCGPCWIHGPCWIGVPRWSRPRWTMQRPDCERPRWLRCLRWLWCKIWDFLGTEKLVNWWLMYWNTGSSFSIETTYRNYWCEAHGFDAAGWTGSHAVCFRCQGDACGAKVSLEGQLMLWPWQSVMGGVMELYISYIYIYIIYHIYIYTHDNDHNMIRAHRPFNTGEESPRSDQDMAKATNHGK